MGKNRINTDYKNDLRTIGKFLKIPEISGEEQCRELEQSLPALPPAPDPSARADYLRKLMALIVYHHTHDHVEQRDQLARTLFDALGNPTDAEPDPESLGAMIILSALEIPSDEERRFSIHLGIIRGLTRLLEPDDPHLLKLSFFFFVLGMIGYAKDDDKNERFNRTLLEAFWDLQTRYGPENPRLVPLILILAKTNLLTKMPPLARVHLEWAKALAQGPQAPDDAPLAETLAMYSEYYETLGESRKSEEALLTACRTMEQARGKEDPDTLELWINLGGKYVRNGRCSAAISELTRTVGTLERLKNSGDHFIPMLAAALEILIEACEKSKQTDQAEAFTKRLNKIYTLYPHLFEKEEEPASEEEKQPQPLSTDSGSTQNS